MPMFTYDIPGLIIYKEMFLGCDWLIRVQLIPNITQNSAKICNNSAKICNNSAKICNKLFERWDLLAKKPKIWRPNFHVCLKISSKFQHNLGFFTDNYDHKTNSKVCWNFERHNLKENILKYMNNSTPAYLNLPVPKIWMSSKLQLNFFKTVSSHLNINFV